MLNTGYTGMDSVKRAVRRGFQQIARDRAWMTTVIMLSAFFVLMQMFIVFLLGIQGVGRMLGTRAAIQLEVVRGAPESDIQEFYAEYRSHPAVYSIVFIPRDQAYTLQRERDPELITFLEQYDLENPFPDTFSVTLRSLDQYDMFIDEVKQEKWRTVIDPSFLTMATEQEGEMRTLIEITNGLSTLSVGFIIVALLVLFFTIVEWISRTTANRGHELLLEHLLGAPSLAVLLPFAAEMAILLLFATVIGTAVVLALFAAMPVFMPALALEAPYRQLQSDTLPLLLTVFPLLLLLEVLAMPVLAVAGSIVGARKSLPKSFSILS